MTKVTGELFYFFNKKTKQKTGEKLKKQNKNKQKITASSKIHSVLSVVAEMITEKKKYQNDWKKKRKSTSHLTMAHRHQSDINTVEFPFKPL